MDKFFKIGTIVEQGSDSKLLNIHLEQELQGETQNESASGGLLDPEPTWVSAINTLTPA